MRNLPTTSEKLSRTLIGKITSHQRFMRQRIDVQEIYTDALYRLEAEMGGSEQPLLPEDCPFTLDDLVAPRPDVTGLVAKIKPVR